MIELGRTNGLIVIIPAHFIGGVLGVTALKFILTRLGLDDMLTSVVPIIYQYDGVAFGWQVWNGAGSPICSARR